MREGRLTLQSIPSQTSRPRASELTLSGPSGLEITLPNLGRFTAAIIHQEMMAIEPDANQSGLMGNSNGDIEANVTILWKDGSRSRFSSFPLKPAQTTDALAA